MIGQKNFRKLAISMAVAGSLFVQSAWGLGLGEIQSKAQLNQPLKAQIRLLSSKNFDVSNLKARIASHEVYRKYGVTKEPFHNTFNFEVETLADGTKVINVTSKTPIREPFVNFLVELNWPQGRMLREYTILLDPPVYTNEQQAIIESAPTRSVKQKRRRVSSYVSQPQRKTARKKASKPKIKVVYDGDTLKVERGQTLWSIATQIRPEGATVQQTLAALYRSNPNAFINNDIDRYNAGVRLEVPALSKILAIDKSINYNTLKKKKSSEPVPLDMRKTVVEKSVNTHQNSGGRLTISSVTDADDMSSSGTLAGEGLGEGGSNLDAQGSEQKSDSLSLEGGVSKQRLESFNDGGGGLAVEDATLSVISGSAKVQDADDEALHRLVSQTDVDNSKSPGSDSTTKKAKVEKSFWQKDGFWKWPLIFLGGLLGLVGLGVFAKRRFASMNEDISGFDFDDISSTSAASSKKSAFKEMLAEASGDEDDSEADPDADAKTARARLANATELLEKALVSDPDNQGLRVKLMELYQMGEQPEKLMALYKELPEDFEHDSPLGLKVASLMAGVGDLPAEELSQESEANDAYIETDLPDESAVFGDVAEVVEGLAEERREIDLSDELEGALDPSSKQESTEEFVDEILEQEDTQTMPFDTNTEQPDGSSLVDKNDDSLLGDSEAKTKVELASAYMEMGDYDSARDILDEVKKDGSDELKQMADELLAKI